MKEQWLPVVGWEGKYEVSNLGKVRSVDRLVKTKGGGLVTRLGQVRAIRLGQNWGSLHDR